MKHFFTLLHTGGRLGNDRQAESNSPHTPANLQASPTTGEDKEVESTRLPWWAQVILMGMATIFCLAFIMAPVLFGTAAAIGAVVIYREVRNEDRNNNGTND
jgi:Mg2+/citrate symporter